MSAFSIRSLANSTEPMCLKGSGNGVQANIVAGGDPVLYSIALTNLGPSDAYTVTVNDVVDSGLTLLELGKTTETALMSGGVIILITAAGGAFGLMLKEAGVKDSVVGLVGEGGQNLGLVMLCVGFGVAAVMKTAQGSSTVAMITTSSMVAAMGVSQGMLGFHPVFLAVAIGCGSLVGSWMNDSGFWIFARMSVLTETEALKTWTILLSILGTVAFGLTLLAARLLPLTAT